MGRRSGSIGGKNIRLAHLERRMDAHDKEIAQKMSLVLMEFHGRYVDPLRERIEWLELPFYRRWWISTRTQAANVLRWLRSKMR